jgi:hypothetical protein
MNILIPPWFYGFDSVMYLISALVGLLLSYYFYKIHSISSEKRHSYLYFGFLLLSFGLLSLSITGMFSYLTLNNCVASCSLGLLDNAFSLEDFSYLLYFALSISAYALFMLAYLPKKFSIPKLPMIFFLLYFLSLLILLPVTGGIWYEYHEFFHLTAFLMVSFISFRNMINYKGRRDTNSLLVFIAFIFLSMFHLFHIFSFVSAWMYVFAHIFMLISFTSLLFMVARVKKK